METLLSYLDVIVRFLKKKAKPFDGYILGISGGIDSAVAALLAKKAVGDKLLGVLISIESNHEDVELAKELTIKHGIKFIELDLTEEYRALVAKLEEHGPLNDLSKINTKVRLRMVTLYALGQTANKLVLGTDNKDELFTGYFTKYGDGGVDILSLSSLTKGEVREAGRLLGVPEAIINRDPTAGLYFGQKDETELGITYNELDDFLLGKPVSDKVRARALYLHRESAHKRDALPRPRDIRR